MADETTTRAPSNPIDFSAPVTSAPATSAPASGGGTAACSKCTAPISGYYYETAGAVYCPKCKRVAEQASDAADGKGGGMARAALFGLGAALVGAVGYWAFIKITDFDWALVSIAVGMLVAKAIRKGNGDRGGRRYQILAVALTYFAIGGAYAPFMIEGALEGSAKREAATATVAGGKTSASSRTVTTEPAAEQAASEVANEAESLVAPRADSAATHGTAAKNTQPPAGKALVLFLVAIIAIALAGPIAIIAGGLPGSIINLAIVGFALRRAWLMTASGATASGPSFSGPYNVKSRPASVGAPAAGA